MASGFSLTPESRVMYETWEVEFQHHGITESAAKLASMRLLSKGAVPAFHFPALMKIAKELAEKQASSRASGDGPASCEHCAGAGVVSVIRSDGGETAVAHCVCNYGRSLFEEHRKTIKGNLITLNDVFSRRRYRVPGSSEIVTWELASLPSVAHASDATEPIPQGRDLAECIKTARGNGPPAAMMRGLFRRLIREGKIDPDRIPEDAWEEREEPVVSGLKRVR